MLKPLRSANVNLVFEIRFDFVYDCTETKLCLRLYGNKIMFTTVRKQNYALARIE